MDTQSTESVSSSKADTKLTFEQKADQLASEMKKGDDGKYHYPEGEYSDELRVTAMKERRRRDVDSTNSKLFTKLKATETVNGKLTKQILASPNLDITPEDQERLSKLMYDDPAAWRKEMNKLEQGATSTLQDSLAAIDNEATQQAELERREEILANFNKRYPEANLTDEIIEQELPPRFMNNLKSGNVSFEQFLNDAYAYIKNPKVVGSNYKVAKQPNLGSSGGSSHVPSSEKTKQMSTDYKNVKF